MCHCFISCLLPDTTLMLLMLSLISVKSAGMLCCFHASVRTQLHYITFELFSAKPLLYMVWLILIESGTREWF